MNNSFSNNLKILRMNLKISQQKLADNIGITNVTLSKYESGERTPDVNFLYKLSKHYNVNTQWLITGSGEMFLSGGMAEVQNVNSNISQGVYLDIEKILKELMLKLNAKTLQELSEKLGTSQSTISGWKSRNAIGTMIEKVIESGNENLLPSIIISTIKDSQYVSGDDAMFGDKINPLSSDGKKCKEIDPATLELFLEIYREHKDKDSIKNLRKKLLEL